MKRKWRSFMIVFERENLDNDIQRIQDFLSKGGKVFLDTEGNYPEIRIYCTKNEWYHIRKVFDIFKEWLL